MSEEVRHEVSGPPMLAMTSALRPPPARISKIGENLTLPFSVQINQLVAVSVGAFAGLVFVTMFILPFAGGSIVLFGSGLGIGGFLGMVAVTWSPLKGESLKTWLGLSVGSSRREKVEINGVEARAYIGIMPLPYSAAGELRIVSRAVDVPAGSVDDRGVFIPLYEARPVVPQGSLRLPGPEDGFDTPKLRSEDTGVEPEAARRPRVATRHVTPRAQRGGEQLPPQPPLGNLPPPSGPRR
jgi:hypothetical protein